MLFSLPMNPKAMALVFVLALALSNLCLTRLKRLTPLDRGRELAVDGDKSAGKYTSQGVLFVPAFIATALLTLKVTAEWRLYLLAILLECLAGHMDDRAQKPWGQLTKGLIDFGIAAMVALTYTAHHDGTILLPLLGGSLTIPPVLLFALIVLLVWESVNATNITDGVDGLSSTVALITLGSFALAAVRLGTAETLLPVVLIWTGAILPYLWRNACPCTRLMGDAGSRAMGALIAIAALTSKAPFLFIPFALVIILDGSASMVKISVRRYLRARNFMQRVLTPLHDHARKNLSYSPTQVVFRFALIQLAVSILTLLLFR